MKSPRQDKTGQSAAVREKRAWQNFQAWCRGRGLCPLPAHPWTVAAYVRWCEAHRALGDIPPTLRAIAARHSGGKRRHPEQSPLVRRTLDIVERRRQKRRATGAAPKLADLLAQPDIGEAASPAPKRPRREAKTRATTATKTRAMRASPKLVSRRTLD